MTKQTKFLSKLDWTHLVKSRWGKTSGGIQWIGNVGIKRLTGDRIAKISLNDFAYAHHYTGVLVVIINTHSGEIDRQTFKFDQHLGLRADNRADKRLDWPTNGVCFYATDQFEWYIARPKSTLTFCDEVENYIRVFR